MSRKHNWNGEIMHIYSAYPRRVARGAALPAIRRALDRLCAVTPETFQDAPERFDPAKWLLESVQAYAKAVAGQEKRFVPHPSTWFNQERYLDDPSDWRHDGYIPATITPEQEAEARKWAEEHQ